MFGLGKDDDNEIDFSSLPDPVEMYRATGIESSSSNPIRRLVADPLVGLAKGAAVGIPETAVGLLDIPTMGYAGKVAETVSRGLGLGDFKSANEMFDNLLTPETREAQQKVAEAKGFLPTIATAIQNPSSIVQTVAESIPSMVGGMRVAGGIAKLVGKPLVEAGAANLPRIAKVGGIAEGVITAGQNTEQTRQQTEEGTLTPSQVALNTVSGILTGILGVTGARLAKWLKIDDVDMLYTAGRNGMVGDAEKNIFKKVLKGAFQEGVLEELPQSMQEQIAQNLALNKPIDDGVFEAGAMGMLAGFAQSTGANIAGSTMQKMKNELDPINQTIKKIADETLPGELNAIGGWDNGKLVENLTPTAVSETPSRLHPSEIDYGEEIYTPPEPPPESFSTGLQGIARELNVGQFAPLTAEETGVENKIPVAPEENIPAPEQKVGVPTPVKNIIPAPELGKQIVDKADKVHRPVKPENGSSLDDLTNSFSEDIYSKNALEYFGEGNPYDKQSINLIKSLKNKPDADVKIYRTVDKGVKDFNSGDWVTINKKYAVEHGEGIMGGKYDIIEKTVKAKNLISSGDSLHEFGYYPETTRKVQPGTTKQPWQMTKEEFIRDYYQKNEQNNKVSWKGKDFSAATANIEAKKLGEGWSVEESPDNKDRFVIVRKETLLPIDEYIKEYGNDLSIIHKQQIQQALKEGKSVLPETLAEYPELTKKELKTVQTKATSEEKVLNELIAKGKERGYVKDGVYTNFDENIKIGDEITMNFSGAPVDFPKPWKLKNAENYFSTVDYKNRVKLTVEASNGKVMVFDDARIYSPRSVETVDKKESWQERRKQLVNLRDNLSRKADEQNKQDPSFPPAEYDSRVEEINSVIESGDLVNRKANILKGNTQEKLEEIHNSGMAEVLKKYPDLIPPETTRKSEGKTRKTEDSEKVKKAIKSQLVEYKAELINRLASLTKEKAAAKSTRETDRLERLISTTETELDRYLREKTLPQDRIDSIRLAQTEIAKVESMEEVKSEAKEPWNATMKSRLETVNQEVAQNREKIIAQSKKQAEYDGWLDKWTPEKAIDSYYREHSGINTSGWKALKKGETWKGRLEKLTESEGEISGKTQKSKPSITNQEQLKQRLAEGKRLAAEKRAEAAGKPIAKSVEAVSTKEPWQTSDLAVKPNIKIESIHALKQSDGKFKLFYRGTRNEVFPGNTFNSATDARNFFSEQKNKAFESNQQKTYVSNTKKVSTETKPAVNAQKKITEKEVIPTGNLFTEGKKKESDIPFNRGGISGLQQSQVQSVIDQALKSISTPPKVNIIQSNQDCPESVQKIMEEYEIDDAMGFTHNGEVYLVANNIRNEEEILRTMAHELTHSGLGKFFQRQTQGKIMPVRAGYEALMDAIYRAHTEEVEQLSKTTHTHLNTRTVQGRRQACEEWLCNQSYESQPKWYDKLVAIFNDLLRAVGLNVKLSDAEVRVVLQDAFKEFGGEGVNFKIAHHGTPHIWMPEPGFPHGRPRLDKIGTGEGATSYGWGWYSAEAEGVGKGYIHAGVGFPYQYIGLMRELAEMQDRVNTVIVAGNIVSLHDAASRIADKDFDFINALPDKIKNRITLMESGSFYKLEIPDDVIPKLLDWDKQIDHKIWTKILTQMRAENRPEIWHDSGMGKIYGLQGNERGHQIYSSLSKTLGSDKAASNFLARAGIPGNKYLDQMSRNGTVTQNKETGKWFVNGYGVGRAFDSQETAEKELDKHQSRNYVIWDQKVLDRIALLERNGEKLDAIREEQEQEVPIEFQRSPVRRSQPMFSRSDNPDYKWWEGMDIRKQLESLSFKPWQKFRDFIADGYVPITRAEADKLYYDGMDIFVARVDLKGAETTGNEGWFMRPRSSFYGYQGYNYDETYYQNKKAKKLYQKYSERYSLSERGREDTVQEGMRADTGIQDGLQEVAFSRRMFGDLKPLDYISSYIPDSLSSWFKQTSTNSVPPSDISQTNGTWEIPASSTMNTLNYILADRNIDLRDAVKSIEKTHGILEDQKNTSLKETLFSGRLSSRLDDFVNNELHSVISAMAKNGISIAQIEEYLHARHAEEANDYLDSLPEDKRKGNAGISTEDANDYLDSLDPALKEKYEKIALMLDKITHKNAQLLVDYGLESQETIDKWFNKYKHYVPLFREDIEERPGTGQGFTVAGSASKGRTGSERKVVHILSNIAMQRERTLTRGEKNRVSQSLVSLAENFPNEDFWKIIKIPRLSAFIAPGIEAKIKPNVVVARIKDEETGEIKHIGVQFNENNKRAMRMATALKNMDMDNIGEILGTLGKITRYVSAINTQYNPVFGVTNFFRDMGTAAFNLSTTTIAGKQKEVLSNVLPAMKGIWQATRGDESSEMAKLFKDFQLHGGQTGYRNLFVVSQDRAKAIEKELKSLQAGKPRRYLSAFAGILSDYNTMSENSIRLSAYKVGIESGMTKDKAAAMAKNLTVNFNKKGQIAGQAGALYAFFNASVQGAVRMYETLKGPKGYKIIAGGIILGAAQAMMLAAAGFKDEEPPEFVKERNVIIPIGDKKYITFPMPLGFNVIPNVGRILAEITIGGGKNAGVKMSGLIGIIMETFNPLGSSGLSMQTVAPTFLDPFAALAENKNWTGRPIYKEDFNSLNPTPGTSRVKDSATALGRGLAWAFNILTGGNKYTPGLFSPTPDQIDYLSGQITGGLGREIGKTSMMFESLYTGEELPAYKLPLTGRFYGTVEGQANESNKYYSNLKKLNVHEANIKGRIKDREPVSQYIKNNPEAKLWRMANTVENTISRIKKRRESARTPEAKKIYDKLITLQMKRLNDMVEKAGD